MFEEQEESRPSAQAITEGGGDGDIRSDASENDSGGAGSPTQSPSARISPIFDESALSLRPTHVVYLAATTEFILREEAARKRSLESPLTVGGTEGEDKLREDIERYFAAECQAHRPVEAKVDRPKTNRPSVEDSRNIAEEGGIVDGTTSSKLWLPATAVALREDFMTKAQVVDAEVDLSSIVDAVDLQLTGGETPAFVSMLAWDDIREGDCLPVGDLETDGVGGCAGARTERDQPLGVSHGGEAGAS